MYHYLDNYRFLSKYNFYRVKPFINSFKAIIFIRAFHSLYTIYCFYLNLFFYYFILYSIVICSTSFLSSESCIFLYSISRRVPLHCLLYIFFISMLIFAQIFYFFFIIYIILDAISIYNINLVCIYFHYSVQMCRYVMDRLALIKLLIKPYKP